MALYPFSVTTSPPLGIQPLAPGTAVAVPLSLVGGGRIEIDLVQATGESVQDFTLRCWISREPVGSPDASLPPYVQTWAASKSPGSIVVCLFDRDQQSSDSVYAVPATPGKYFLNTLNLTNQPNQFWLTLSDGTATPEPDDLYPTKVT